MSLFCRLHSMFYRLRIATIGKDQTWDQSFLCCNTSSFTKCTCKGILISMLLLLHYNVIISNAFSKQDSGRNIITLYRRYHTVSSILDDRP